MSVGNLPFSLSHNIYQNKSGFRKSLLLITIVGMLLCTGVWAYFAEVDDVTRVDARVVPSGDIQVVQASHAGVLNAILVNEGDHVRPNDTLMVLDNTIALGELSEVRSNITSYLVRIARIEAELAGRNLFFISDEIELSAPDIILRERRLMAARFSQRDAELAVLNGQRQQSAEALIAMDAEIENLREHASLIDEEIALISPLVIRGVEPRTTLLRLQRELTEIRGIIIAAEAERRRTQLSTEEIDSQIQNFELSWRAEAISELANLTASLSEAQVQLPSLQQQVDRTVLRSPVAGTINEISVSSLGAVVHSGETLLRIVPFDDAVILEGYVRPSDIAFIRISQSVRIKITAYDFTRYGALDGEIMRISADTVPHPIDDTPVFVIDVRAQGEILDANSTPVTIGPGMIAEIDILRGRKTIADYLIRPVFRVRDTAFRD